MKEEISYTNTSFSMIAFFAEEMEKQRIANYDFERGDVKY